MPISQYSEQHLLDQVFSLQAATVNAALTAGQTAVTAITCTALGEAVIAGETILLSWGTTNVEAFVVGTGGAAIGATSIPVTSQTSAKAHAIGDLIVRQVRIVAPTTAYVGLAIQTCTLNQAMTPGTAYTALTVTALNFAVNLGDVLLLGHNGEFVVASAAAAAAATSISINSFQPQYAYSSGENITDVTTIAEPSGNGYARVSVTTTLGDFPVATGDAPASKKNAAAITYPASTGAWSANYLGAQFISDSSTGRNVIWFGALNPPALVNQANVTPQFAIDALVLQLF